MTDCGNYVLSVRGRNVQSGDGSDVGIQISLNFGSLLWLSNVRSVNECWQQHSTE